MELYVKTKLNGIYVERKCSVYQDEEIELTRSWYDQQILQGYGSYSNTFSIPTDSNNCEIFHYYDVIYGTLSTYDNQLNPNYWFPSRLIINGYEILGNVQVQGFSTKNDMNYSFNIVFYGDEKDLVSYLNKSDTPKLNDIPLSGVNFTFNFENVTDTWTGETFHFVPISANERPLSYKEYQVSGNINYNIVGTLSGVNMSDLAVSYNFKQLLDKFFNYHGLTLVHSDQVTKFLYKLYMMPNTKVEYTSDLTYIYVQAYLDYTFHTDFDGMTYNKLKITGSTVAPEGIMTGNQDEISWDNILNINVSDNFYSAQTTGKYDIALNTIKLGEIPAGYVPESTYNILYYFVIMDMDSEYGVGWYGFNLGQSLQPISINLVEGKRYLFCTYMVAQYQEWDPDRGWQTFEQIYTIPDNVMAGTLRISKSADNAYEFDKSTINFPDIFLSDFFNNFCKSFNIFYIYNSKESKIYTYFKQELIRNNYDLNNYLLLDKNYTWSNESKYKMIDYSFAEGKDINNLAWKQENPLWYGEYKQYFNYDVGIDKLEYKSQFTIFPRTTLNLTDLDNFIIEDTLIPLHSELNQSFNKLNTDYLIFYKQDPVTGLTRTYSLQNGIGSYTQMTYAADYGPTGYYGYDLDYNKLTNIIKDNVTINYEVTLEFLLPFNILYNIRVYDYVIIRGIWYEIKEITSNMRNGYTQLSLLTITNPLLPPPPTTTTTTTPGPTTTTTTTPEPTTTTTTTLLYYFRLSDCANPGEYKETGPYPDGTYNSGERVEGATDYFYVVSGSQLTTWGYINISVTNTGFTDCP